MTNCEKKGGLEWFVWKCAASGLRAFVCVCEMVDSVKCLILFLSLSILDLLLDEWFIWWVHRFRVCQICKQQVLLVFVGEIWVTQRWTIKAYLDYDVKEMTTTWTTRYLLPLMKKTYSFHLRYFYMQILGFLHWASSLLVTSCSHFPWNYSHNYHWLSDAFDY